MTPAAAKEPIGTMGICPWPRERTSVPREDNARKIAPVIEPKPSQEKIMAMFKSSAAILGGRTAKAEKETRNAVADAVLRMAIYREGIMSGLDYNLVCVFIEKVGFAHIQHEVHVLIYRGPVVTSDLSDHSVLPGLKVQIYLETHRLHDLAGSPYGVLRRLARYEELVVYVFRADAEDDLFVHVGYEFWHHRVYQFRLERAFIEI